MTRINANGMISRGKSE